MRRRSRRLTILFLLIFAAEPPIVKLSPADEPSPIVPKSLKGERGENASSRKPGQKEDQLELEVIREGKQFGFAKRDGTIVVKPTFDNVKPFSEGMAAVNTGAKQTRGPVRRLNGGHWGYVNAKGELVIRAKFDSAGPFSCGLALVRDPGGFKFIEKSGRVVIDLTDVGLTNAGNFSDGVAPLHLDYSTSGGGWRTRFIDVQGKAVFSVDGYASEFHEGMAVLSVLADRESGSFRDGYIDRQGRVAIPPRFAEAFDFSEGLAGVRVTRTTIHGKGDTWGYIDKTGKYVIEPHFNEVSSFQGGTAKVHVGGALHVVRDAPAFWEGGEWWQIDRSGKRLN